MEMIEENGGFVSISEDEARQILDLIAFVQTIPLYLQNSVLSEPASADDGPDE